ncbi:MAG: LCP family protein [Patescibacteria group bacterium]|nr:LCP family protein [Patescibacteria group bacterium]
MKKFLILGSIFILIVLIGAFSWAVFSESIFFFSKADTSGLGSLGDYTFLLLGKPGPGYIGSQNTDSLMAVYYNNKFNKLFLIAIPRDLIVRDEEGNFQKINALYEKGKKDLLLNKVSLFTGLNVKDYFAIDLELVKQLVDRLGGIEIYLEQPVVDAVSFYTIPPGRYVLNGYLIELVLRSRYNSEGDFFRIRNQMNFLNALKDKLLNLNNQEIMSLLDFINNNKNYWESSFSKNDLLFMFLKTKDLKSLKIVPIIVDLKSGPLKSGHFELYGTPEVYGIYPSAGIDNFEMVQFYIRSKIRENLQ